jgi:hypothetical protein
MNEKVFQSEIKKNLELCRFFVQKFYDLPVSALGARTDGFRFTPEKPCDFVVLRGPVGALIECKMIKKFKAFSLRDFRPSQIRNFNLATKLGVPCYCFLNVRIARPRVNRLIIIEWKRLNVLLEFGSLYKDDVEALEYVEGKGGLYDLSDWIKELCGK